MTNTQLEELVTKAVTLHREITAQTERLEKFKTELIREARRHKSELALTDNGGSRWTAAGTDDCIARVDFPAPALLSLIDCESGTFDHILAFAGECMDELFESVHYLRPISNFRERAGRALPGLEADKLIDLCQTKSSPHVSFETAEQRTK